MKQYFTPQKANKTLPLVKKIVEDIMKTGRQLREAAPSEIPSVWSGYGSETYEKNLKTLQKLFHELEHIGCSFKDWNFSIGLVDFPAKLNGEEVLLCWRSDEPELKYYHGLEEGFAGRKLIPPEYLIST